jgi:hypothetical protein
MTDRVVRQLDKGIELIEDVPGRGAKAEKGFRVVYNARFFLRQGDEVTNDPQSIALYRGRLNIRQVGNVELIDHATILGRRQPVACVEKALYGMQAGGYREILAGPHLCYGKKGIEGRIPPNAMLRVQLWVRDVRVVS